MDEQVKCKESLSKRLMAKKALENKRLLAQKTIDKCKEFDIKLTTIQAKDVDNQSLEDFFTNIVIKYNAPISCLPEEYKCNKDFLKNLIEIKPALLNQIYSLDENHTIYQDILPEIDNLHRLLIRCKCFLIPQIRYDIHFLIGTMPTVDDFLPIPKFKKPLKK